MYKTHEKIYLPCIAHLTLANGLNHFVVIYKISKNHVYIMDPASGKKKIEISEFLKEWTNILILLTPITNILHLTKEITISKVFVELLKKNKKLFIIIVFLNCLLMLFAILGNFYFQITISSLNDLKFLKIIIIIFFFVFLFKVLFNYLKNYYLNFFHKNIDTELFTSFLEHIFYLPLPFIENRTTGEIVSRVEELSNLKNLLSEVFTTFILNSVLIFGTIVALYLINSRLFFFLCLVLGMYLFIGLLFSKVIYNKAKENIDVSTEFNTSLIENISMNTSIKNLNLISTFLTKLENKLIILLKNNFLLQKFLDNILLIKDFIYEIGIYLILTIGIYFISINKMSLLELITFNSLIVYLFEPLKELLALIPKYNYLKASFNKISEFLNIKEEEYNIGLNSKITSINFTKVNYSYNQYQNILNNISFDIKKGDKVLLEGPSGSGKSTICKLIFNSLNKTYDGKITYNLTSEKDINLQSIRSNILYIGQEENLFTGTIKDNIICNRNINPNDLLKVLKICHIEEIIAKRPNRLETVINASLNNLSGGEKQRIILARGLLKKCNVIILDEALSEVDIQLEKSIIEALITNFKTQTLIYVSHKDVKDKFSKVIKVGKYVS